MALFADQRYRSNVNTQFLTVFGNHFYPDLFELPPSDLLELPLLDLPLAVLNVEFLDFNIYFTVFIGSVLLSFTDCRLLLSSSAFLAGVSCTFYKVYASGGASSVLLKDGMTRAPIVRFGTAKRDAELKFFVENPANFDTLLVIFNRSSRFARLQSIQCAMAGKNLYMSFTCSTGDVMRMNMVLKGVQNDFPDMDVISISGNFCSYKKPSAVNWIEGRGKYVVCKAIITEEVVRKVLKTTVPALVELNMLKNLTGSAVAGALGGFNAHASNIVSAVFIATGKDPAQNIENSHCITMMEAVN
ncbi:hypothetical protein IFM89_030775 [Coptis chinensis]|uniref:hydroxymethylglutaryl-CoA reductase (NADPH) n=1 Tax=Coptis chinensis TaxID=261450 RepID=A0A835IF07_9MAGN|nr:hypothetical protein IFM89_030775 [Coptis chinensis]